MPAAAAAASDGGPSLLHLVHRLPEDDHQDPTTRLAICSTDPDVAAVMASKNAKVLRPGSALRRTTSTSGHGHAGAAAIRMPMLRVSNFVDASSSLSDGQGAGVSYAIMVLVLPAPAPTTKNHRTRGPRGEGGGGAREWSRQELEIVEVAADQLAVALSHAAVLKEWQLTRHKLAERQRVLVHARHDAAVATRARDASQSAMRDGVLRPMHSVAGLLSLMQAQQHEDEAFRCTEQRVAVGAMARISALSTTLTDDVMAALLTPTAAGVSLARRPFDPRALVKDAAGVAGCLARCRGLGFSHRAEMSSLPAGCWVVGDDRRVFHLLLHMVGVLLDQCECHCHDLCFAVDTVPVGDQETMSGSGLPDWITPNFSGCNTVCVRFRFGITRHFRNGLLLSSSPRPQERITRRTSVSISSASSKTRLSIATCNKIVQMMNGKMWWESTPASGGQHEEHMSLILHFQLVYGVASPSASSPAGGGGFYHIGGRFGVPSPSTSAPPQHNFNGLRVLLLNTDDTSREVTRKLLERLGCQVLPVPSAARCLSLLLGSATATGGGDQPSFQSPYLVLQAVLVDLHTPAAAIADAATAMDDGFEVALRIREVTGDRFSWLLILVALPLPPRASRIDVRDVCKRTGVNGVIYKPISPSRCQRWQLSFTGFSKTTTDR
ncbi:Protein EIN4 [Zea mays]|nr:Protein EIN4 [Zea mays]